MKIKNIITSFIITSLILCSSCNRLEFVTGSNNISRIESVTDGNTNIASFSQIGGLTIDEENNSIYILDVLKKDDLNNKYIIRKLQNNAVSTIYQSEITINTIKFNDGYLYISDEKGISKLNNNNISELIIAVDKEKTTKDGKLSESSLSSAVSRMDFDKEGNLYIIDSLIPDINKLRHSTLLRKINLKEGNIQSYDNELFYSPLLDKNLDYLNMGSLKIDKSTNRIYFYNLIGNIPSKITEIDLEKGIVDYSVNTLLKVYIGNFIFDNMGNFYIITYKENKSYIYRIVKNTNKKDLLVETDSSLNSLLVDNKNNLIYVVASNNKIYKVKIQEKI